MSYPSQGITSEEAFFRIFPQIRVKKLKNTISAVW
uniref:Uncharacterized protein n=1 Tax=Anguilla anguilla TaxID=7936 RepID=A0A0E9TSK8_ANGAN